MITARQYAEMHDMPYTTVATWLQRDLIPGAEKQELPYGGYVWMVPDNAPKPELKPGPKTFEARLRAIAAEVLKELSSQYSEFAVLPRMQDSNDRVLTYVAHSGERKNVVVIRRASQTDDEVKGQIRAQLTTGDEPTPSKPKGRASKRSSAKKASKTTRAGKIGKKRGARAK